VRPEGFVTGVVLAAGGSSRLGRPKQLLPYRGATLLDSALTTARECRFDQLLLALGAGAEQVRASVDMSGTEVVLNERYGSGCSSSIVAAIGRLDARCDVLVLLLGDQPGVTPAAVNSLLAGRDGAALAICRYDDGRGHPLAFGRAVFEELARLKGDKAVWKLLEQRAEQVAEVHVPGPVPRDVDTWDDYEAALAAAALP
jgi:molybdenum cofactor cytidylyltransferase